MNLRYIIPICILSLTAAAFPPTTLHAQDKKSPAEKAWKAGDAATAAPTGGERWKGRQRPPQSDEMGDPPMAMGAPPSEGMDGPPPRGDEPDRGPREAFSPAQRLERKLMQMRAEAQRLANNGDAEMVRERIASLKEAGTLTPDREQRLEKIATLRTELNNLEREEFAARAKFESQNMLKTVQERLDRMPQKEAGGMAEQLAKTKDSLGKISESAGTFEALAKALDEMAPELPSLDGSGGPGGREERMRREIDVLRKRLENIQREYGGVDGDGGMDEPSARRSRPRVGINGNDEGMYQGFDDPPPAARRKDSQAGQKKSRDSDQGNATK